jgi:serine/threonine protein phosphatase PrpC
MRTGFLRGREHTRPGAISAIAEGRCAAALSIGGAAKRYEHRDPNEDAVGFAEGPGGIVAAVADGHGGFEAAELAVQRLLEDGATRWTGPAPVALGEHWTEEASEILLELNAAILDAAARGASPSARTTLAWVVVRPQQDRVAWASLGDSHIFHVGPAEVVDLAYHTTRRSFFLGFPSETTWSLRDRIVAGCEPLGDTRALVLASDGLSERGIGVDHPEACVGECFARAAAESAGLRALALARGICEFALESQRRQDSGDNVASAVVWLQKDAPNARS